MFEGLTSFFKKVVKNNPKLEESSAASKDAAKERLHLVLMQDRANVSADFLDLMKQEIIDVIKKYVDIDEKDIDVRLTNQANDDGTNGAPALYANIPIINIKNGVIGEKMRENSAQITIEDFVNASINSEQKEKESIEKQEKELEKEVAEEPKEEVPEVIELGEPVVEEENVKEESVEEIKKEEEEAVEEQEATDVQSDDNEENNPEDIVTHKKNRTKKTSKKR